MAIKKGKLNVELDLVKQQIKLNEVILLKNDIGKKY